MDFVANKFPPGAKKWILRVTIKQYGREQKGKHFPLLGILEG